jgi:hypothetical protein
MGDESHGLVRRLTNGLVGAAVSAYAFLDDLFLGPILVALAAWLPWYVTLVVAASVLVFVNIACCNWVQGSWESWIHGNGARLEARLERMRNGRLLKYPIRWVTRDSTVWFTIAAGLIGTVIVVGVNRLIGGHSVGHRRVLFGSISYSVGFAATYSGIGLGLGDLIRAL